MGKYFEKHPVSEQRDVLAQNLDLSEHRVESGSAAVAPAIARGSEHRHELG